MRQCQCQGVGHCCLGPRQAPVRPPSAHEETDRRHSGDVGWMERERKKKEREERMRGKKRAIEGEGLDSCLLPSLEASSSQS